MPDNELILKIAGISIKISSEIPLSDLNLSGKLLQFRVNDNCVDNCIEVNWKESIIPPKPAGELVYDPGLVWRMYNNGETYSASINYTASEPSGILNISADWKNIEMVEKRSEINWMSTLNSGALELVLRGVLMFHNGLVFHSSGVDDNGKGILFAGHSGEGKSTQSSFWEGLKGAEVFNEDRNAVRSFEDGAVCYGTPWGGTANIAKNREVPLSAIILIEQSQVNKIERIYASEAAPLLLARAFLPYWDINLMKKAIENLDVIISKVPVFRLSCKPEPEVVNLVRSVL